MEKTNQIEYAFFVAFCPVWMGVKKKITGMALLDVCLSACLPVWCGSCGLCGSAANIVRHGLGLRRHTALASLYCGTEYVTDSGYREVEADRRLPGVPKMPEATRRIWR